jgi:hypothetical protein
LGFNKDHIFNSYKYKLPVNSVDISKICLFYSTLQTKNAT